MSFKVTTQKCCFSDLLFSIWSIPLSLLPRVSPVATFCIEVRKKRRENERDHLLTTVGGSGVLSGTEQDVFGGCRSFLASAQCSNTTANSVTGGINSSAPRPYRKHRPRPPSSSLYNTLDAPDKEKATERRGRERVCRMCWENTAQ